MPKGETSKDPVQFPAKPQGNPQPDDSVNSGLAELTQLARQAFEDKRRKQCLSLTRAILKIDPENKEALVLQSWLRASLQKETEIGRALLVEARASKSLPLYDRAERSLRAVLGVDAENEEAKALLHEVVSSQIGLTQTRVREEDSAANDMLPVPIPGKRLNRVVWGLALGAVVILGVFGASRLRSGNDPQGQEDAGIEEEKISEPAVALGSVELLMVPAKGVQVAVDDSPPKPAPQVIELTPGSHRFLFTADGYVPQTVSETIVSGTRRILPILMKSAKVDSAPIDAPRETEASVREQPVRPPSRASNDPPRPVPARPENKPPVAAAPMGMLSLTAAVPVDVYRAGKKLGTTGATPLKLQLPVGTQAIEYRYQGLQKTMSHAIANNETTEATIVFDVNLGINSSPWAEVSVEGSSRPLGETPLSNVTVAVGSVLVFKNPNFAQKKYRVTGSDATIWIVFP